MFIVIKPPKLSDIFDVGVKSVTLLLSLLAICISLFGEKLRDYFGWRSAAKLSLHIDREAAPAAYHHGWIEDALAISDSDAWAEPPSLSDQGRLKVHFFRAKISNLGRVPARSVTVWLRRLEYCDPQAREKDLENVMSLRWSDMWRLTTDTQKKNVNGSACDINFDLLPEGSAKYCDLLFYYDLGGPAQIGGLQRSWLYLPVLNVPSSTYAIKSSGSFALHLHVAAENAKPVQEVVDVRVNWNEMPSIRMELRRRK